MTKSCLCLIATVLMVSSSGLFACDDEPPAYFHFKDYPAPHGPTSIYPTTPTYYDPVPFTYKDLPTPQVPPAPAGALMWHSKPNPLPSCPRK